MEGFTVRAVLLLLFTIIFTLSSFFTVSDGAHQCRGIQDGKSKVAHTITVSKSGGGNFTRVQDAIKFVPINNNQWVRIYVDSGMYWEQVKVDYGQDCILLEGRSRKDTIIMYDAHESTNTSPTFQVAADNFVAKHITFKNSYNFEYMKVYEKDKKVIQAVALSVYGDKAAFYDCAFIGYQDTLWDAASRHYFKDCYIEGAVDFIWGDGQSIYEDCSIYVIGYGYITAQGRKSSDDHGGFVFKRGSINGNDIGIAYLGRAYGSHSTVIFHQTSISNVVIPLGWNAWRYQGQERKFTYSEINCTGAGADLSHRVDWEKRLSESEVSKYISQLFIDPDNWISEQP